VQVMYSVMGGAVQKLPLPQPDSHVLPGIPWGAFDELLTPAFWRGQAWQHEKLGSYRDLRLGRTLSEEVAACMLGGFGMKAELGLAAFARLRDQGLLVGTPTVEALEVALSRPFVIHSRTCGYRFPRAEGALPVGVSRPSRGAGTPCQRHGAEGPPGRAPRHWAEDRIVDRPQLQGLQRGRHHRRAHPPSGTAHRPLRPGPGAAAPLS
jgi:hypothetical protein